MPMMSRIIFTMGVGRVRRVQLLQHSHKIEALYMVLALLGEQISGGEILLHEAFSLVSNTLYT